MPAINACQFCGSRKLRMPGLSDGVVPETDTLSDYVCNDCGQKSVPLIFDDLQSYAAFRAELNAQSAD